MHPDWARSLRDQCVAAGVPFFFKQWGAWLPLMDVDNRRIKYNAKAPFTMLAPDGQQWTNGFRPPQHLGVAYGMKRVGKKKAGSMLDGREWREFPNPPKDGSASNGMAETTGCTA